MRSYARQGLDIVPTVHELSVSYTHLSPSAQQAKKITGKVLDAAGEPIIGASVLVKGSMWIRDSHKLCIFNNLTIG